MNAQLPWLSALPTHPFPLPEWKAYLDSVTRKKAPQGWCYLAGPFNSAETVELIHIIVEMMRGDIPHCIVVDTYGNRKLYRTDEGWLRGDLHLQRDDDE